MSFGRRERQVEINLLPGSREALEAAHGQVWNTDELFEDFEAIGFMQRFITVEGVDYRWREYLLLNPFKGFVGSPNITATGAISRR